MNFSRCSQSVWRAFTWMFKMSPLPRNFAHPGKATFQEVFLHCSWSLTVVSLKLRSTDPAGSRCPFPSCQHCWVIAPWAAVAFLHVWGRALGVCRVSLSPSSDDECGLSLPGSGTESLMLGTCTNLAGASGGRMGCDTDLGLLPTGSELFRSERINAAVVGCFAFIETSKSDNYMNFKKN